MTVKSKWGVLMAADGRTTIQGQPPDDHTQKIIPILDPGLRTAMYALVGEVGNDDFDTRAEFARQISALAGEDLDPSQYVEAICRPIAEAMTKARYFPRTNERLNSRWKILTAVFAGCFGSSVGMVTVQFSHLHREVKAQIDVLRILKNGIVQLCQGPEKVYDQMYRPGGAGIPNSPFSHYIHPLGDDPSVSEAIRFAVGYIEACCSPLGRELDPKAWEGIGGHIHVATIKPRSGFAWLIPPITG